MIVVKVRDEQVVDACHTGVGSRREDACGIAACASAISGIDQQRLGESLLKQRRLERAARFGREADAKARERLGYAPRYTSLEAVIESVDALVAAGVVCPPPPRTTI